MRCVYILIHYYIPQPPCICRCGKADGPEPLRRVLATAAADAGALYIIVYYIIILLYYI